MDLTSSLISSRVNKHRGLKQALRPHSRQYIPGRTVQQPIRPKEVDIAGEQVVILWDDGHRSIYPHRLLRLRCPCANCIEEMTGRQRLDPDQVPEDVKALDQMQVGSYALQFLWSDTHYTGIYPYQLLRSICTCIPCNQDRAAAQE